MLDHLRAEGFNRLSMGVQDFNKEVQRTVNREQDEEFIFALLNHARDIGFTSTNIDLIYGLPKQTPESFAFTLKRVTELNPDRLSVFNYAHLPTLLPPSVKLKMPIYPARSRNWIFCRRQSYRLLRPVISLSGWTILPVRTTNWPSRSAKACCTVIFRAIRPGRYRSAGDGVSAISMIGDGYMQNQKELKRYYQQVDERGNALWRGITLTRDDCIRRDVIKALICNFRRILTLSNSSGVCISLSILPKICSYCRRWRKMGWWILARREFR